MSAKVEDSPKAAHREQRNHYGPAYGQINNRQSSIVNYDDWPTYRHDALRSGANKPTIPAELGLKWETDLKGRISPPVAARGKVFLAEVDCHRVKCVAASSGEVLWSFTAGARVDSPPTSTRALSCSVQPTAVSTACAPAMASVCGHSRQRLATDW